MATPHREAGTRTPPLAPTELAATLRQLAAQTEDPPLRFGRRHAASPPPTELFIASPAPGAPPQPAPPPTATDAPATDPPAADPPGPFTDPAPVDHARDPEQPAVIAPEQARATDPAPPAQARPPVESEPPPTLEWPAPERAPDIAWHRSGAVSHRARAERTRRSRALVADRPWEPAALPEPPRRSGRARGWWAGLGATLTAAVVLAIVLMASGSSGPAANAARSTPLSAAASTTIPEPALLSASAQAQAGATARGVATHRAAARRAAVRRAARRAAARRAARRAAARRAAHTARVHHTTAAHHRSTSRRTGKARRAHNRHRHHAAAANR
jgi:hypothetical protein